MWVPCKIILLLFLVCTQSSVYGYADSTIHINQLPPAGLLLDKGWTYMPGDNPLWANPGWNDSDWQPIDPTLDIHELPQLWQNETGWFRLRFSLDSALQEESLALLVVQTGASEIYLNGRLLAKYGQLGSHAENVRAAYPPFGEFISLPPARRGADRVLAVRFALQKNIPYVNFAGRYNRALALKVMEIKGVTRLSRSNIHYLDYLKSSIFFTLALLHLVLFYFSSGRKANLYFFIYALLSMLNFMISGYIFQHVHMADMRMYLLILIFLSCTSSYFLFLQAIYSNFNTRKGPIFWLLTVAFFLSLPLFLWEYQSGWILGLTLYPIFVFLESARITFLADRKKIIGVRVVTYGAIAFLVLYPLAMAFFFGLLPTEPNQVLGQLTFNFIGDLTFSLAIVSLPISLSIYLATEASFTSRSLEAKLVEVQQLSEKALLQEREKRRLLETDELKSRFFTNISHEFRTPLSLIRITVEKLKKKEDPGAQKQADYGVIDQSAGRLLQMVNQLLDLSRLEAGKLTLHPQKVNISAFLKVLAGSFVSLFESKGITYRYTVPLQPLWLEADKEKLEGIVNNLLSNAAKFTPAKGQVNFTIHFQPLDTRTCCLHIQVQDTGIGISPAQLPRIFERFYQADNSATRQYEGTGIGLALVKELVELHGGKAEAQSTEGEGSLFLLQIPLSLTDAGEVDRSTEVSFPENLTPGATNREAVTGQVFKTKTNDAKQILVVEDNTELRHFICENLQASYQVAEAENGTEGYQKAIHILPDLIISDVMMPGLDGISLCRKLKEDERTTHIPVILLTAKADSQSKLSGLETGADDYLTKPFSLQEVLLRVANLIRQRQQLKEKFSRTLSVYPTEITVTSADERFLQKILCIVEQNIANAEFDVEAFSREVGMSRAQLNRKITALVDQSSNEFIRSIRLKRAAYLLKQNGGNVAEIAFMVGFSNPSYFTKCFRDYYGVTPSEYLHPGTLTENTLS